MAKNKFFKTVVTLGALGVASKVAYDKYKNVKSEFEKEENDSLGTEVKKYNAIFQNKVVEVDDEVFTGCEVKAIGSKAVIDLGLAVFEKDVYIDFTSKASSVTIVLPEGVNAACDIEKRASVINNLVENTDEEGIHTVYVIGTADASRIQIVPVDFYVDDEDDFEDIDEDDADGDVESASNDDKKAEDAQAAKVDEEETASKKYKDEAVKTADEKSENTADEKVSENDDLENMEDPDDESDLRKIDGAIELTVEEVTK